MRLVLCAVSAIALSGCSWLGGLTGGPNHGYNKQAQNGAYSHHKANPYSVRQHNTDPCQIFSPQQPIPRGCDPSQVTLATKNHGATNGFPQQPQFGQPNYATGNYGSHAGVAHQQGANHHRNIPQMRKPKFRGSLSLGAEKSFSGDVLDYATFPTDPATGLATLPTANYDPNLYIEGRTIGSVASGQIVQETFSAGPRDRTSGALYDSVTTPTISFDDAWSTPTRIAIGGEYILSKKNTVYASAGYTASEGKSGVVGSVNATLYRDTITQDFDNNGAPIGAAIPNTTFHPDEEIARFTANFSDMKRYDLEVGGRHYFNPWNKSAGVNTVTPFVGAAVGASHYNAVSYRTDQQQRFYEQAFNDPSGEATQFYELDGQEATVGLYDSQWVPSGQLNAGLEWQVTPRTGLAFETGVRFEGARKYTNDEKGDTNVAIPFTIRGSYNF